MAKVVRLVMAKMVNPMAKVVPVIYVDTINAITKYKNVENSYFQFGQKWSEAIFQLWQKWSPYFTGFFAVTRKKVFLSRELWHKYIDTP